MSFIFSVFPLCRGRANHLDFAVYIFVAVRPLFYSYHLTLEVWKRPSHD